MDDRVTKVTPNLYATIKGRAERDNVSMSEALDAMVKEARPTALTECERKAMTLELARKGITAPKRLDWVVAMTDVLGELALTSPKLAPYYEAREEASKVCPLVGEAEGLFARATEPEPEFPEGSSVPVTEPETE